MEVKRAKVVYGFGCSCGGSVSKRKIEGAFFFGDEELYQCDKCGKEDYFNTFNNIILEDNFIYCSHCEKNTHQVLIDFDDWSGIVECKCSACKSVLKTDLTEKYCKVCKVYYRFKEVRNEVRGDYCYTTFKCTNCNEGVYEESIFVGD